MIHRRTSVLTAAVHTRPPATSLVAQMTADTVSRPRIAACEQERPDSRPKVWVIIPCDYGRDCWRECLPSFRPMCNPAWDVLVGDDGSTQDIRAVVEEFSPSVRYFRQANKGPSVARNTGFQRTTGEYLRFLDADDYLLPAQALKEQIELLDSHSDVGMVYAQALKVTTDRRPLRVFGPRFASGSYIRSGDAEVRNLLFGNHIAMASVLARRTTLAQAGLFRPELAIGEDWECWLRMARCSKVAYVAEPVFAYRAHENSITAQYTVEPWLAAHEAVFDGLFSDTEFARRYAPLRQPAYACMYKQAAQLCHRNNRPEETRHYAWRALMSHLGRRRWRDSTDSLVLIAKSCVPSGIRPRLRFVRRRWARAVSAARVSRP